MPRSILIPVGGRRLGVRHRWVMDLGDLDLASPALGRPELRIAGVEEYPVEPGVEAVDVTQGGQVAPAADERLLDGVLRAIGITKDQPGGGVEPGDRGTCQHGEGVMIALPRSLHEVPLHVRPRLLRGRSDRVYSVWWDGPSIRSRIVAGSRACRSCAARRPSAAPLAREGPTCCPRRIRRRFPRRVSTLPAPRSGTPSADTAPRGAGAPSSR